MKWVRRKERAGRADERIREESHETEDNEDDTEYHRELFSHKVRGKN